MGNRTCFAFLLLLLAGCGSEKGTSGPDGSGVDLAKDEAAMAAIQSKLDSLVGRRPADIAEAALAAIRSMPEFKASGISEDGSVWAQFQDGVLFSIGTHDVVLDVQGDSAAPAAPLPRRAATAIRAAGEIPGSATAYVFNAFEAYRGIPADQIADQLAAAGYKVVRGTGSLKDWRGVSEAGLVFSASHGTRLPVDGSSFYYLQASDAHKEGDRTHAADLEAHRMAFDAVAVIEEPLVRGRLPKWHWEVRYLFKSEYLSNPKMFAPDGFFFNAACSGMSGPGFAFAQGLRARNNLSVYAGWSQPVYVPDDVETMLFFFDRALGLHQFAPVDAAKPPPAEWSKVLSAMGSNARASGNGTRLNASDPQLYDTAGSHPVSVFSIQDLGSGGLATLVPSAEEATSDATDESLVIEGHFGSAQGRVSVNGTDLTVKKWTSTRITTSLPKANGKLLVTSKTGLLSNRIDVEVASKVAMTPKRGGYVPGDRLAVSVTPESGSGVTYAYHWKAEEASNIAKQDQSATRSGLEFISADPKVRITTTPSTQGTLKVTCIVFTGTGKDSVLIGSASAEFRRFPFSNRIEFVADGERYFSYVLLKKDTNTAEAPLIQYKTYVDGELKATTGVRGGAARTPVHDVKAIATPGGPPSILLTAATTQFADPDDFTFTATEVPYPYDLGDAIALVVTYAYWQKTDSASFVQKRIEYVKDRADRTLVEAGLAYP